MLISKLELTGEGALVTCVSYGIGLRLQVHMLRQVLLMYCWRKRHIAVIDTKSMEITGYF